MLFLPGPVWLLLSKIARRLIYSLYISLGVTFKDNFKLNCHARQPLKAKIKSKVNL